MKTYNSRTLRLHVLLWIHWLIKKRCKGVGEAALYPT